MAQSRYLFAIACLEMDLFCEAEAALLPIEDLCAEVCDHLLEVDYNDEKGGLRYLLIGYLFEFHDHICYYMHVGSKWCCCPISSRRYL